MKVEIHTARTLAQRFRKALKTDGKTVLMKGTDTYQLMGSFGPEVAWEAPEGVSRKEGLKKAQEILYSIAPFKPYSSSQHHSRSSTLYTETYRLGNIEAAIMFNESDYFEDLMSVEFFT